MIDDVGDEGQIKPPTAGIRSNENSRIHGNGAAGFSFGDNKTLNSRFLKLIRDIMNSFDVLKCKH